MISSLFLSTPSSQRATSGKIGEDQLYEISIHALFAEGDESEQEILRVLMEFLSTPSSQRATEERARGMAIGAISIHALFAEGDLRWITQ